MMSQKTKFSLVVPLLLIVILACIFSEADESTNTELYYTFIMGSSTIQARAISHEGQMAEMLLTGSDDPAIHARNVKFEQKDGKLGLAMEDGWLFARKHLLPPSTFETLVHEQVVKNVGLIIEDEANPDMLYVIDGRSWSVTKGILSLHDVAVEGIKKQRVPKKAGDRVRKVKVAELAVTDSAIRSHILNQW